MPLVFQYGSSPDRLNGDARVIGHAQTVEDTEISELLEKILV